MRWSNSIYQPTASMVGLIVTTYNGRLPAHGCASLTGDYYGRR